MRTFFTGFRDIGSLLENYVYLKIKRLNPCYVYKDGAEIDFLTGDKTLIEVKYHNKLSTAQQRLFDSFNAKKKVVINNLHDIENWQVEI